MHNNDLAPEQLVIVYGALGLVVLLLLVGCLILWWKIRVWRKEYQLTSMEYRGIPVDVGSALTKKRKKFRKEPRF